MRKENGVECPSTLGEYLLMCKAIQPNSKATAFLKAKIAAQGEDAEVVASDSQMHAVLMPMLLEEA